MWARLGGTAIVILLLAIRIHGQTGTDFSGSWVLESADAPRASAVPDRIVVEQPITTTNMRGGSMPPAYLYLKVERHFADRIQTDNYTIGVIGGVAGGTASGTTTPAA